jgi:hypothetical protein
VNGEKEGGDEDRVPEGEICRIGGQELEAFSKVTGTRIHG